MTLREKIECMEAFERGEEIVKLKLELFRSYPKIANKKSRSIVAMLFWEARKSGSTKRYGSIIKVFNKAYKMLKDDK